MNRKTVAFALVTLLCVTSLFAQGRMHPSASPGSGMGMNPTLDAAMPMGSAAMVSGTVTAVSGSTLTITGGFVIDASQAKIAGSEGTDATLASVGVGSRIVAMLKSGDAGSNGTLVASVIAIQNFADVSLTGTVQSVDAVATTFTVLGKTIYVTPSTSFGGTKLGIASKFSDILPGTIVHAEANFTGGRLNATSVQIMAPMQQPASYLRGTVKSITATQWTITTEKGEVIVNVTAQTKIAGDPKAGDQVDIQYTLDSANNYVAVSIAKRVASTTPPPSTNIVKFTGTVKTIGTTSWVIVVEGKDTTVTVNEKTRIAPGIAVNDRVSVGAQKSEAGLTAIVIEKMMMGPGVK